MRRARAQTATVPHGPQQAAKNNDYHGPGDAEQGAGYFSLEGDLKGWSDLNGHMAA